MISWVKTIAVPALPVSSTNKRLTSSFMSTYRVLPDWFCQASRGFHTTSRLCEPGITIRNRCVIVATVNEFSNNGRTCFPAEQSCRLTFFNFARRPAVSLCAISVERYTKPRNNTTRAKHTTEVTTRLSTINHDISNKQCHEQTP